MIGLGTAKKSLLTVMSTALLLTSGAVGAQPALATFGDDVALLFCSQVRHNNSQDFRNKLREYRLRIRDIYPRIRCNGESMIQFAHHSGSAEIGRFIANSVLIRDLYDVGDVSWARQLPQQNSIRQVIEERLQQVSQ
ncbi:Protein of unknown function [Pseudidiomarina maritima]|jgi:hypothetical protein|uniref:DUF3718 domain-containing protein n=2 Tax=Pseudidiomarina maritima TaxID=519453 RepID=A0A1I6GUZ7_9GAMM|nr:Protein of unknown function [Pseudidiomarina maritima]